MGTMERVTERGVKAVCEEHKRKVDDCPMGAFLRPKVLSVGSRKSFTPLTLRQQLRSLWGREQREKRAPRRDVGKL